MKTTKFIHLSILLFLNLYSFAQNNNYPYDKWTSTELNKAATYRGIEYMNKTDTAVLFYCNLARINPKLFRDTYLSEYKKNFNDSKGQKIMYINSLWNDLSKLKKEEPLYPQKDLCNIAEKHAETMGKKGKTGHDNYDKRFKYVESKYTATGENCDYGNSDPLDIVMSLLIDEGIVNLGHRKNILSSNFNSYGGSLKPHTKYNYNYVMDFGFDTAISSPKSKNSFWKLFNKN